MGMDGLQTGRKLVYPGQGSNPGPLRVACGCDSDEPSSQGLPREILRRFRGSAVCGVLLNWRTKNTVSNIRPILEVRSHNCSLWREAPPKVQEGLGTEENKPVGTKFD